MPTIAITFELSLGGLYVEGFVSHEIGYEATVLRDTILQVLGIDLILWVLIKSRSACHTGENEASAYMRSMTRTAS